MKFHHIDIDYRNIEEEISFIKKKFIIHKTKIIFNKNQNINLYLLTMRMI